MTANPVAHFEIIGSDPEQLRRYYGELFGWEYEVGDSSSEEISQPGQYGFTTAGINGGVAGGKGHRPHVLIYVGVPDVEQALRKAEELGGKRVLGPVQADGFQVGHFLDPEGNLVGVAG